MHTKRLTHGWEHYRGSLGGVWEVWRGYKLHNHFNVPWEAVTLPHCFNALDAVHPDCTYYQGEGWYRTLLEMDNPYREGRTLLHFEGVGQQAEVFVHTHQVGSHIGGYDAFTVDISDQVDAVKNMTVYKGKVPLAVKANNRRDLELVPSDISDFNLYGGLYRYVHLVYVPAISIESVHVHVTDSGGDMATIDIRSRLYNPNRAQTAVQATIDILDADGEVLATRQYDSSAWDGEEQIASVHVQQPKRWSPDHPYLYSCRVRLQSEHGQTEKVERFGIRHFTFEKNGPFYLNGERLLLRGTHRHEDFAGVGAAMTEDMIRAEMKLIKEMGANFIRLGHYQQSKIVLDLCDELGLLVWEEIPWCRGGLGGERYQQQCIDMLTAMIDQHYNHPSIIIWGLGNENDWEGDFESFDPQAIRSFMRHLHDLAHELDDHRLTAIRRCDFCKDIVDVYSPSIWSGWYRGIYTEYETYSREAFEDVDCFFHMEWGADNVAGRHSEKPYTGIRDIATGQGADERDGDYFLQGGKPRVSSQGDWSETYFCELIDWYLKSQEKMDWLTGSAQWAFKDFSTPVRPDAPVPYMNLKGIVERDLTKKEAYYVFQSYWAKQPMVRIYGHSNPVRWGAEGERKTIRVYSNCPSAELLVNGQSMGHKKRNSDDFPCAGLRWDVVLEEGGNNVRVVAEKDGIVVEDHVQMMYQTAKWGDPSRLNVQAKPTKDGRVFVEVKAYDQDGVYCADASLFVRFALAGDGRLLEHLGTVNGSRVVQLSNGRGGIYVDPRHGSSVVSVSAEHLPTVFTEVKGGA